MQIQTRLRRLIRWLVQGGGALLGVASLLGFLSAYRWQFDMLCHWRVQYSIVFVLLTALFVWRRRWRWTGIFAVFALVNLAVLWPCLPFFRATPPVPAGAARLKILHANVFYFNHHYERLLALIEQEKPDIIALCELTPDWVKALKAIDTAYPNRLSVLPPNYDGSATGVWSKIPGMTVTTEFLGSSLRPTLIAKTDIGGAPVTFLVAHTTAPFGKATILAREEQLYAIADRIAEIGPRVVLIGDLNTTPWSFGYRETIRKSGLRDAAREGGVLLSWPGTIPIRNIPTLPLMRIPIDHVLVSPDLTLLSRRLGPSIGSDHFPVIAEIAVPPARLGTTTTAWDEKSPIIAPPKKP